MLLALAIAFVPVAASLSATAATTVTLIHSAPIQSRTGDDPIQTYPELNLKIDFGIFEGLAADKTSKASSCRGEWAGTMAASKVRIFFNVLDSNEYGFSEPEDVVESWRDAMTDPKDQYGEAQELDFTFEATHCLSGHCGASPILAATRAAVRSKAHPENTSTRFLLAGLLPDKGWSLRVDVTPPLEKAADSELSK
jgi:hypothetical protein